MESVRVHRNDLHSAESKGSQSNYDMMATSCNWRAESSQKHLPPNRYHQPACSREAKGKGNRKLTLYAKKPQPKRSVELNKKTKKSVARVARRVAVRWRCAAWCPSAKRYNEHRTARRPTLMCTCAFILHPYPTQVIPRRL